MMAVTPIEYTGRAERVSTYTNIRIMNIPKIQDEKSVVTGRSPSRPWRRISTLE